MSVHWPGALLAVFLVWLVGETVVLWLLPRKSEAGWADRLGLGFGLGSGALVLQTLLMSWLHIAVRPAAVLIPWVPVALGAVAVWLSQLVRDRPTRDGAYRRVAPDGLRDAVTRGWRWVKEHPLAALLVLAALLFIVLQLVFIFVGASSSPLYAWDSWSEWGMTAKVLYHDRGINPASFKTGYLLIPHPVYPVLIPNLEAWVYQVAGAADDQAAQMAFPFFLLALVLSTYGLVKRLVGRQGGLIAAFTLVSIPVVIFHGRVGYADLPMAYFYGLGSGYLYLWLRQENWRDLSLAALLLGFAMWTRADGWVLFVIVSLLAVLFVVTDFRPRWAGRTLTTAGGLVAAGAIYLPWYLFVRRMDIRSPFLTSRLSLVERAQRHLAEIPNFAYGYYVKLFKSQLVVFKVGLATEWNIFWWLFVVAVVLFAGKLLRDRYRLLLGVQVMGVIAFYFFLVVVSKLPPGIPVEVFLNSTSRYVMHTLVIVLLLVLLQFEDLLPGTRAVAPGDAKSTPDEGAPRG